MKFTPAFALSMLFAVGAYAQKDSTGVKKDSISINIEDMSLEDLMNVPIVSASREKEDAFDAPVTSYVVTRQEIEKAGSTSIPEALRLCPALFVTEVTNGVYQVDIRGLNNAPAFDYAILNKTTLVMIDNRPVFNQLQGGTFWANLPVDINDVERIEVVAGPSAALYGPNAVSGVINIITRKLEKKGLYLYTNSQFDAATKSIMANASVGYKFNDKFSMIVSGNYNGRKRFENDFYDNNTQQFVSYDNLNIPSGNPPYGIPYFQKSNLYPNPNQSVEKKAANLFLDYKHSEKVKFDLASGLEQTSPLSMLTIGIGPSLAYANANSIYIKGRAEVHGFTLQVSNVAGKQSFMSGVPPYQYDYRTTDAYLDYTYKFKNLFSLKPALSYQNAFISDLPYKDPSYGLSGIFNNAATMYNYAGSLKFEITPIKMIRFVAAVRADRFRYPDAKAFLSYEFVLNIKPSENHNIRLVASRSYQGSYIFNTFVDFSNFKPNKNLEPAKVDLLEAGYRVKISNFLSADLSLFRQEGTGYSQLLVYLALNGTSVGPNLIPSSINLKTIQTGATLSFNTVFLDNKIQFKPFVTIQNTQWQNHSPYSNVPSPYFPNDGGLNSGNTVNLTSKATPSVYGGFFLNINPISKLNINISSYMYDKYSLYSLYEQPSAFPSAANPTPSYTNFNSTPASNISGKVLLNAKVSYEVIKNLKVFLNARNLTNTKSREFYGSDQIGGMYLVGLNFEY
jgi:iron complex outermembrane receptor protein